MTLLEAFQVFDRIDSAGVPYCCNLPVIENSQDGRRRIFCQACGREICQIARQWVIGKWGSKGIKLPSDPPLLGKDKGAGSASTPELRKHGAAQNPAEASLTNHGMDPTGGAPQLGKQSESAIAGVNQNESRSVLEASELTKNNQKLLEAAKRKPQEVITAALRAVRSASGQRRAKTLTREERQKGGRRGGAERANKLAPDLREKIARNAALTRWGRL